MAIDSHKHYAMVGGMNRQKEWTLRPRKVQMPRFRAWAANNLRPGDAIVLETTANVWDIYDIVAPLVSKTVVANAYQVRQIAEARVKTDQEDVKRLITVLMPTLSLIPKGDSVVQRFNLKPPEGHLLAEKNQDWWDAQEFSALTGC